MALLSNLEEEPNPPADEETSFQDETKGSLGLWCKVVGDGEVEITHHPSHYAPDFLPGQTLEIPKTVTDESHNTYTVVGIGEAAFADPTNDDNPSSFSGVEFPLDGDKTTIRYIDTLAFWNCTSVTSLEIPKGVTKIGKEAFHNCIYLRSVNIADTVTEIGYGAFWSCTQLRNITLPNQISAIQAHTFDSCGLRSGIDIPNSVTEIGESAFYNTSLKNITIPSSVRMIGAYAFDTCIRMSTLYITVKSDRTVTPITATETSFTNCLNSAMPKRGLYFRTEDGTPLSASTTPFFETAKDAYDQDGDRTDGDGLWWNWTISEESAPPEPPEPATYTVTIQARLNEIPWNKFPWNESPWNESEHPKKTFALRKNDGDTYITNLTAEADGKYSIALAEGTYKVYEIIGTPEQTAARAVSDPGPYLDTGITVTVDGKNPDDVVIDYYTATFYNESVLYDNQIVLKNVSFEPPLPPTKEGHTFGGWKTSGGENFNFEQGLANKTDFFASWTATDVDPKTYLITAKAGEGGSIFPVGDIEVTEGPNRTFTVKVLEGRSCTFTIQADPGYRIKTVIVDETTDLGALERYEFTDVRSDRTIEAEFEETKPGGGDEPTPDNPGGGETDPDNPGGVGGSSDPGHSDDDHSGGSSGSGGGSDTGSSGDSNSGGGGSTESTNLSAGSSLPEAGAPAKAADPVSGANVNAPRPGEPKTGDASHLEVYASIAMIAGFVYLILYLMDGMKGMSEEEKNRRIASLLGWAKRGRAKTLRRYLAITAVFFVLAYYHAFGKQAALGWQKA